MSTPRLHGSSSRLVVHLSLALVSCALVSCDLVIAGGAQSAGLGAPSSPRGPEQTCASACSHIPRCSRRDCARGCNLVLDRLVEHEGEPVIACVARSKTSCDDKTWAACATRIGVYADGGPAAPPPSKDEEDEE